MSGQLETKRDYTADVAVRDIKSSSTLQEWLHDPLMSLPEQPFKTLYLSPKEWQSLNDTPKTSRSQNT